MSKSLLGLLVLVPALQGALAAGPTPPQPPAASERKEIRGSVFTLSGSVLFGPNSSRLRRAARDTLDQVAEELKAKEGARTILVEGHADSVGNDEVNDERSLQRAQAVVDYLITRGLPKAKIRAEGLGSRKPVGNNDTEEGRAANRRVEIILESTAEERKVAEVAQAAAERAAAPPAPPAAPPPEHPRAPVAELPRAPEPAPAVGPSEDKPAPLWSFAVRAGGELSKDSFAPFSPRGIASLELSRLVARGLAVIGRVSGRFYDQGYFGSGPRTDGGQGAIVSSETRIDVSAALGIDLTRFVTDSNRVRLQPVAGFGYLTLRNANFPASFFGLDLGARGRFLLSDSLAVQGHVDWLINALKNDKVSALGNIEQDVAIGGGLAVLLDAQRSIELAYSGDVLVLHRDRRVAHGATIGFETTF